jgi:transcriptional regulator with XRE-family HTH domain
MGWTQVQLARRSGVHQSAISRIENGCIGGVGLATLVRLANALRVPTTSLLADVTIDASEPSSAAAREGSPEREPAPETIQAMG